MYRGLKSVWRRIAIYALMTAIIQATCMLLVFVLAHDQPAPRWLFYIVYNIYMLANPLLYGPPLTPFVALCIGTVSMFLIVCAIGESINRLIMMRE